MRFPSLPRNLATIKLLVLTSIVFQLFFVFILVDSIPTTGLLSDDVHYYLTLAQNFVQGDGIVFNTGAPTNGFHPLYFVISTISYTLLRPYGEKAPVLGLITISILAHGVTGFFIYLSARKLWNSMAAIVSTFFWLFHPAIILIVFEGMEVTVQILIISVLTYYYIRYRSMDGFRLVPAISLGLLMGLAFYSRMDSIFLIFAIAIMLVWGSVKGFKDRLHRLLNSFNRETVTIGLTSFISVLPWMVWSYFTTGLLTPHSGSAQTEIVLATGWGTSCPSSLSPYLCGVTHSIKRLIIGVVSPLLVPPSRVLETELQIILLILTTTVITGLVLYWGYNNLSSLKKIDFLVISVFLHIFYYLFIHLHYRDYYGLFIYFVFTLTIVPIIFQIIEKYLSKFIDVDTVFTIVVASIVLLLFITAPIMASQTNTSYILIDGAEYVDEEIPENATVGAFNAGRLQYYSERDVINLDGVININSYRAIEDGRLDCYIYQKNINYIIDFERGATTRLQNPSLTQSPVNFTVVDRLGPLIIVEIQSRSPEVCEYTASF